MLLWGGLLPPRFVGHHGGWNIAAVVFGFGLIGVYGWPWLLLAWSDAPRALTGRSGAMVFLVLALALMVPSSYEVEAGRWGGWLWEAVRRTPTVLNRSVLLTVFAVVGALTLATLAHGALDRGRKREMGLLVVALVAWMATQSANFQVWQRYFEPAILIFLSWLIALAPPPLDHGRWLLPLAVASAASWQPLFCLSMVTSTASSTLDSPAGPCGRAPMLAVITLTPGGDGVAVVAKLIWRAFERRWRDARLVTMFDGPARTPGLTDKAGFAAGLMTALAAHRPSAVVYSHLGLARAQAYVPSLFERPYAVFLHGIEAWGALDESDVRLLQRARLRLANSAFTACRVSERASVDRRDRALPARARRRRQRINLSRPTPPR